MKLVLVILFAVAVTSVLAINLQIPITCNFFIATTGNDTLGNGTKQAPYLTMEPISNKTSDIRCQGGAQSACNVCYQGGTYPEVSSPTMWNTTARGILHVLRNDWDNVTRSKPNCGSICVIIFGKPSATVVIDGFAGGIVLQHTEAYISNSDFTDVGSKELTSFSSSVTIDESTFEGDSLTSASGHSLMIKNVKWTNVAPSQIIATSITLANSTLSVNGVNNSLVLGSTNVLDIVVQNNTFSGCDIYKKDAGCLSLITYSAGFNFRISDNEFSGTGSYIHTSWNFDSGSIEVSRNTFGETKRDIITTKATLYNDLKNVMNIFNIHDNTMKGSPQECEPGNVAYKNIINCFPCFNGTYANDTTQPECTLCPRGSANNKQGQSQCPLCQAGYFTNSTGQDFCESCPYALYSLPGSAKCSACDPGSIRTVNKDGCILCSAGTYQTGGICFSCTILTSREGSTTCQIVPWYLYVAGGAFIGLIILLIVIVIIIRCVRGKKSRYQEVN